MTSTGFFGIPGHDITGQVHVLENGKPICGTVPHPKARFQWCANGVRSEYLTCKRCIERLPKLVQEKKEPMADLQKQLASARESVLKAAKAWVDYEDDGRGPTAHLQGQFNLRLVRAVTRLERLEDRARGKAKTK
jgi:hypothetical protein